MTLDDEAALAKSLPDHPDTAGNGELTRDQIRSFDTWLDNNSSRQLKQSLVDGELLLIAQISNADQEAQVYSVLSKFNVGRIQLHDMPRTKDP